MSCNENKDLIKDYEYFDATADVGFYSYGVSLEEAYENAGRAMFDVITDIDKVNQTEIREFEIISEDLISLLYDYLEELLFLQETEFLFFSKFEVIIENIGNCTYYAGGGYGCNFNEDNSLSTMSSLENYKLTCKAYGEEINWNVHSHGSEVKAITFHKMDVVRGINGFKISAILDL